MNFDEIYSREKAESQSLAIEKKRLADQARREEIIQKQAHDNLIKTRLKMFDDDPRMQRVKETAKTVKPMLDRVWSVWRQYDPHLPKQPLIKIRLRFGYTPNDSSETQELLDMYFDSSISIQTDNYSSGKPHDGHYLGLDICFNNGQPTFRTQCGLNWHDNNEVDDRIEFSSNLNQIYEHIADVLAFSPYYGFAVSENFTPTPDTNDYSGP